MKIELSAQNKLKPTLRDIITQKHQELNQLRPISPVLLQKLKERFQVEMTYNSNGIEGNTLSLNETYWVFQEGITIKGKSLREHLEVKDHKKALEKLYSIVESPVEPHWNHKLIEDIHRAVIELSEEENDYNYRDRKVFIAGSDHNPPEPELIKAQMKELLKWVRQDAHRYHELEFAALFHHRFAQIHPFLDGNGRTARLLMNIILMRLGYPLVIILKNDRQKYYRALRLADKGKYRALIQLIAQAALRSVNMYLEVLKPKTEETEYITLAQATEFCNYSQEYLSKLAKEGRLDAHKHSRNWVTTRAALEEYMARHGRNKKN